MLKAGDILIGPYPPGSGKRRRFLILSDEISEPDPMVAWVYVSTSLSDSTVVLRTGCHPEITQDCCVIFEEAELIKVAAIRAGIADRALRQARTSLQPAFLAIVQEGVFESEDTPIRVVDFCTNRI